MQKLVTTLLLLLVFSASLVAQANPTLAAVNSSIDEVPQLRLPAFDNKQLLEEEMARRGPGIAPRFAETVEVDISPATHGLWEVVDGQAVWRLRVPSPGARSLNFGFDQFQMPAGGQLMLYTPDQKEVQGPFTPADNEEHEQLWTPIIEGDEIVIEVSLPEDKVGELGLHLKSVNHDFLGFKSLSGLLSGSCNLDVVCGAADGWGIVDGYRDIIQSVAVIGLNGGTFCTGFLVNNARQDCTPFFMTADHCGINNGNAASLVVYWNFINSVCREPGSGASGGNGDGSLADFNTGSIFRSAYSPSDMTLVELDDPVSETANAFFAGWDASDALPQDTIIGIHHPSTDEKRISFEFDGVYTGAWGSGGTQIPDGNHLIIEDWDIGTTEGGSSGSPIFNAQKQVIGQLHGGAASCNNDAYDSYGWFFTSWEGGGSPNSRLKDWLDPDNTGTLAIDGRGQIVCSFFTQAEPAAQSLCAPAVASYNISTSENFVGTVTLSLDGLPSGLAATFDATTVEPGEGTQLAITGTENLSAGSYNFVLNGTDGTNNTMQTLTLNITADLPVGPSLMSPANMAADQSIILPLAWDAVAQATSYDLELATDATFTNVIATTAATTATGFTTPALDITTTYYWRVRASNICGTGDWSAPFSFETAALACGASAADTDGLTIGPNGGTTTTSTLEITQEGAISSIRLTDLITDHTYTGDLEATLTSPNGTTIQLFDQPNCDQPGMSVTFDDNATATAANFVNTCATGGVSIEGEFQSAEPLTIFVGEEAQGTWTLSILDNFNGDSGNLTGWNLDLCTVLPSAITLGASPSEVTSCASEAVSLELTVGSGFEGMVNLDVTNLPAGANANFEANNVMPGSVVNVTITGLDNTGNYNLDFVASAGGEMAASTVAVSVIDVPTPSAATTPADGATDVSINTLLSWANSPDASTYVINLSTNADMSDPVLADFDAVNTSLSPAELEYDTPYYWTIAPTNDCGAANDGTIYSFQTTPNLSITPSQNETTSCIADGAETAFVLGAGLGDDQMVSVTASPAADFSNFTQSFDSNNRELSLEWANFLGITPGAYELTIDITGEGYTNSTTASVTIIVSPGLSSPELPADQAVITGGGTVSFSWAAAANAEDYILEVATDDSFNDIVFTDNTTATNLDANLGEGQYFWRVTAANDCGEAISGFSLFTYEVTATLNISGAALEIWPNPTKGPLQIVLSEELTGKLDVGVFAVSGQRISSHQLPATAGTQSLDLSNLPAGVYLLRITNGVAQATARIIVE